MINLEDVDINDLTIYFGCYNDLKIEIKGLYNIFAELDKKLDRIIYDIGIDEYILKKNRIKIDQYKALLNEYDKLYKKGEIVDNYLIKRACEYIQEILNKSKLYVYDAFNNRIPVEYNGSSDISNILYNLYKREEKNLNCNYKYLDKFMSYLESKYLEDEIIYYRKKWNK